MFNQGSLLAGNMCGTFDMVEVVAFGWATNT